MCDATALSLWNILFYYYLELNKLFTQFQLYWTCHLLPAYHYKYHTYYRLRATLARSVWRVPVWRVPVWRDPLWRDSTLARSTLTRFRHIPYYLVSLVYIRALSGSACDTCVNCDYVRNYVTVYRVDILWFAVHALLRRLRLHTLNRFHELRRFICVV